jgi:hypothetical protein
MTPGGDDLRETSAVTPVIHWQDQLYYLGQGERTPRQEHYTLGIATLHRGVLAIQRQCWPTVCSISRRCSGGDAGLPGISVKYLADAEYTRSLSKLRPEITVNMPIWDKAKIYVHQYEG